MDRNLTRFGLLGALLTGYAILDGFDLGGGVLHPLARGNRERRTFINAIGPTRDGDEVWLVAFGGALFAMFPEAYATIYCAFCVPSMPLLCALVFRAVGLEFRGKIESARSRGIRDRGFLGSSLLTLMAVPTATRNFEDHPSAAGIVVLRCSRSDTDRPSRRRR